MVTIKAIIFDLDGGLTDTAEYHYRRWKRLAAGRPGSNGQSHCEEIRE